MLEFKGELSDICKKFILKEQSIIGLIVALIVVILGIVIIVTVACIFNWMELLFFLIPLILIVPIIAGAPYWQKNKTLEIASPQRIVIVEKDDRLYVTLGKPTRTIEKSLQSIKSVEDNGDWYYLKLRYPKIGGFICQKDLIKQGTIEEFETLFQGKIIRRESKT